MYSNRTHKINDCHGLNTVLCIWHRHADEPYHHAQQLLLSALPRPIYGSYSPLFHHFLLETSANLSGNLEDEYVSRVAQIYDVSRMLVEL
jgi:hypothetical protein